MRVNMGGGSATTGFLKLLDLLSYRAGLRKAGLPSRLGCSADALPTAAEEKKPGLGMGLEAACRVFAPAALAVGALALGVLLGLGESGEFWRDGGGGGV